MADLSAIVRLNLPVAQLKIRKDKDSAIQIFDQWRGRWVALTPEEWVRQNFVSMLISERGYVSGRIANEISINFNGMHRRCDTVVYDALMNPVVIIEYKAPEIEITQATFNQILRYNKIIKAPYLIMSNGLSHYCCKVDFANNRVEYLKDIPNYANL